MLVYDIEILRPPVFNPAKPDYQYAKSWTDYIGMGIAVLVAYSYKTGITNRFLNCEGVEFRDNTGLQKLLDEHQILVGFNHIHFDNNILIAHGYKLPIIHYDILQQLWIADGLSPTFDRRTHGGYSLDAVVSSNIAGEKKSMNGADAPYAWQDGEYNKVSDYCAQDVALTKQLMDKVFLDGGLISPKKKVFTRLSIPVCF